MLLVVLVMALVEHIEASGLLEVPGVSDLLLTANIFPSVVLRYTPLGVLMTCTFDPDGILLALISPASVRVFFPGSVISVT